MKNRRLFFKQFIGQIGVLGDDIRGVGRIPLNRLGDLPENIIEEIEPVVFPEKEWIKKGSSIIITSGKDSLKNEIQMTPEEEFAFTLLCKGHMLKEASRLLKDHFGMAYEEAYRTVKNLFLKLASYRIWHPRIAYDMEKLIVKK
jgi:hypothetical protein